MPSLLISMLSARTHIQYILMRSSIVVALILLIISPSKGYNVDSLSKVNNDNNDLQTYHGITQHEVHYVGRPSRKLRAKSNSIRLVVHMDKKTKVNVNTLINVGHIGATQKLSLKKLKVKRKHSQPSPPSVDQAEAFRVDYNRAKTHPPKNN